MITREGLVLYPATSGVPTKPSVPSSPTSTLLPSDITFNTDASPSFGKYANVIVASASCKTECVGREMNSTLSSTAERSLAGNASRILLRTACPFFAVTPGLTPGLRIRNAAELAIERSCGKLSNVAKEPSHGDEVEFAS